MGLPAPHPKSVERDRAAREWFSRVRGGDMQAFESLFRAFAEPLCACAYSYVDTQETAQEIVQDLFCWMWEHRFTLGVPKARAYLYAATRNRAINFLRDRRVEIAFQERVAARNALHDIVAHAPAADGPLEARDLAEALRTVLREMSPRCREVFLLTRDQQLTYAEVAEVLGIFSEDGGDSHDARVGDTARAAGTVGGELTAEGRHSP